ncbi:hypothetical protein [Chryseobacterium culicis]|uniref:hypothetical protein n=1 Tax=Chryseobacterium culicis TaxID=680127 RepID=UPI00187532B0|nr:hypothetical protein [Chryseobacterium culicis]MBE4947327.1 hypothetical protein [Chryseobacterium culicis]
MTKSKFTESQIVLTLKQSDTGVEVEEISRKWVSVRRPITIGKRNMADYISVTTVGRRNSQLKKLVADLSLDKQILLDVLKKSSEASPKKRLATEIRDNYMISLRRSCDLVILQRKVYLLVSISP